MENQEEIINNMLRKKYSIKEVKEIIGIPGSRN